MSLNIELARHNMIEQQVRPWDVLDSRVLEALSAIRREGLTRDMKSEAVERFFALGFALEQLREHLLEVHRVVSEWARN